MFLLFALAFLSSRLHIYIEKTYHDVENKNSNVCPEFTFDFTYFWCILKPIISIVNDNSTSTIFGEISRYQPLWTKLKIEPMKYGIPVTITGVTMVRIAWSVWNSHGINVSKPKYRLLTTSILWKYSSGWTYEVDTMDIKLRRINW